VARFGAFDFPGHSWQEERFDKAENKRVQALRPKAGEITWRTRCGSSGTGENGKRLSELGSHKERRSDEKESRGNAECDRLYARMSVQGPGHITAAKHANLAPFLISMQPSYHQIPEITRIEWPDGAR
jgi:hypothetical protein